MIKVAVVGSGYWGKNLIRNFHALGALGAICDKDPRTLRMFQDTYQGTSIVHDFDELLDGGVSDINAIVISTPAATHHHLARKVLLAGKHCFVEKPLALTAEEGLDLVVDDLGDPRHRDDGRVRAFQTARRWVDIKPGHVVVGAGNEGIGEDQEERGTRGVGMARVKGPCG